MLSLYVETHSFIVNRFNQAKMRLLLLDYDGTLVHHTISPAKALPTEEVIATLESLQKKKNTTTFIITGRSYEDIKSLFRNFNIHVIAEHGNYFALTIECKNEILKIMNELCTDCTGSFIEQKNFSIAWHYRNAIQGEVGVRKLIRLLQPLASANNLAIIEGNKIVEVMNQGGGKGIAVRELINNRNYDFVLAIGDDTTDETMFEELKNNTNAITIKVGTGASAAKYTISSPEEVIRLLNRL